MPRRTRSRRSPAAANSVKAPVISAKSKSECARGMALSNVKEPDVSEEQDNPAGDVAPGADGDVGDVGDEVDAGDGDVAGDAGTDTVENAIAGTVHALHSDEDDHSDEDALFEPLVLDMEEDDDESFNGPEDPGDGTNDVGEAEAKGDGGDEAVRTTESAEQGDTDGDNQEESDGNMQDDAECYEEEDDADGEDEAVEGDESVEVHEEEAEEEEQGEEEAECVEEDGEDEIAEEDDGDQDAGVESEEPDDGGLAAECKMDPETDEAHPGDVGCSGSGEDSNLLPVQPGDAAEDAGEDVLMDSYCAEDDEGNLEANEFLTKDDAEEHNGEDAGDAEIKEELVDEEATFLVEDIRDLCPSVAIRPAESIPVSLKESIQRSVKIFIEKLLEDHKDGSANSSHDDLTLQQDSASLGVRRKFYLSSS